MPKINAHRADIVAALHKAGTSLSELGRDHGLHDSALRKALDWPRTPSNKIIAAFLGKALHELWPAWFAPDGSLLVTRSNRKRAEPARRRVQASSQKRRAA